MKKFPLNFYVFTLGLGLFAGGMFAIYPPAAVIAVGLILMGISLFGGGKPE